jgi:hypothetical protein
VVYRTLGARVPPDHGQVRFVHLAALEQCPEPSADLGPQAEQQDPRGAAVQAMGGVHAPADPIPHHLQGEGPLAPVQVRAVHEQACRLVDRNQVIVVEQDREVRLHGKARG